MRQNLERQGLTCKILRNKDLPPEVRAAEELVVEKLLGRLRAWVEGAPSQILGSVKVVRHKESNSCCGGLWEVIMTAGHAPLSLLPFGDCKFYQFQPLLSWRSNRG